MNLVFDLDGTLLDSRMRLYRLFQQLVPQSGLSFDNYWELKRSKVSHQQILEGRFGFDAAATAGFVSRWMELIESPAFLALDSVIPGIPEALAPLRERARLYVCTARQNPALARDQLGDLGLGGYFAEVLVTGQVRSKEALIRDRVVGISAADWILGDTGKDVQTGKALGMRTCAVLSGFLNRASLSEYSPDLILESAGDFHPEFLQQN